MPFKLLSNMQLRAHFLLATLRAFIDSNQPGFAIYGCCTIQLKVTFVQKIYKLKQFIRELILTDCKGKNMNSSLTNLYPQCQWRSEDMMEEEVVLDCQVLQDVEASGKVRISQRSHVKSWLSTLPLFQFFLLLWRHCRSTWWAKN